VVIDSYLTVNLDLPKKNTNPVQQILHIEVAANGHKVEKMRLVNSLGQEVLFQPIISNKSPLSTYQIDVAQLQNAIYFL